MKSFLKSFTLIVTLLGVCFLFSCKEDDEIINAAPSISDQSFSIDENSKVGTIVGVINASDPDEGQELTYKIVSGNVLDAFEINSSGELLIKNDSAIDFELNESFELLVSVKDELEGESMALIIVNLNDITINTEGLIAYYPFRGNVNDESSNSFHGTVSGASVTHDRNGNANSALSLNGIDDYITLGSDFSFENASINIWFKVKSYDRYNSEIIFGSDHLTKQNGLLTIATYGRIDGYGKELKIRYNRNGEIVDKVTEENAWHMATITYEGSDYRFFLDGILVSSDTDDGDINSQNGLSLATVGCGRNLDRMFDGLIDDLRIYDRALSKSEVEVLYHEID